METILLKNGNVISGEVLKEKADALVIDLGFTIVTLPVDEIKERTRRGTDPTRARKAPSGRLYTQAEPGSLKDRAVKDLVRENGQAVTLVATPGGMGSGFVIDKRGYVVTNFHVIRGEQEITITIFRRDDLNLDRVKVEKVKIVAINPFLDLALLKLDLPEHVKLNPLLLGTGDDLRDGQAVFAIGNPLGLERTVSEGIVSSTRRNFQGQLFVQTTAPINPGNSGGPLFNLKGEVIGVTNMKAGWFTEGLSFAIPVDTLTFFLRNRDVFAFDKDNPNNGYHYLPPPRKARPAGAPRREAE
jgi:serine protease Do